MKISIKKGDIIYLNKHKCIVIEGDGNETLLDTNYGKVWFKNGDIILNLKAQKK